MAPQRKVDNCFCFRLALAGAKGIGKTTLIHRLQKVKSFEKLMASVNPVIPSVEDISVPSTEYVDTFMVEFPVGTCQEISLHRSYIYELPAEKAVLRDGIISKSTLDEGVDGVIYLVDGTKCLESEEQQTLLQTIDLCVANETHILIVSYGAPVGDGASFTHPLVRVLVCEKEDFVQLSMGLLSFIGVLHDFRSEEEAQTKRTAELLEQQRLYALQHKEPLSLPCREVRFEWSEEHFEDPTMELVVALYGAPNTGKTTFATALLDGFVVREHEPTKGVEVGTFALSLAGARVNATLYDGRSSKFPKAALGLIFVDVSSPTGLVDANRVFLGVATPPTVCVLGVKEELGSVTDPVALRDFAGEIPAMLVEVDPRKAHQELIARLVLSIIDGAAAVQSKAWRSQLLLEARAKEETYEVPAKQREMMALFLQFDADGTGTISLEEAEELYQEHNRTGFGDPKKTLQSIIANSAMTSDPTRVTFDQFSIMMCQLAKM